MTRKFLTMLMLAALVAFSALAIACGDDDDDDDDGGESTPDPAEAAEFEEFVAELLAVDPTVEEDVDFFLDHVTEDMLGYLGYASAEECRAAAEDCIGSPTIATSFSDTQISEEEASTVATGEEGDVIQALFIADGDVWLLNGFAFTAELPADATVIDVEAVDYAYDWDPPSEGEFAITMTNGGTELHEAAVVKTAEDFDIEELIANPPESEEDLPPGVEEFIGFGFASPGATSNIVFEAPLEPGSYALICFIPDAEGTPHVALGMHSEFTIE